MHHACTDRQPTSRHAIIYMTGTNVTKQRNVASVNLSANSELSTVKTVLVHTLNIFKLLSNVWCLLRLIFSLRSAAEHQTLILRSRNTYTILITAYCWRKCTNNLTSHVQIVASLSKYLNLLWKESYRQHVNFILNISLFYCTHFMQKFSTISLISRAGSVFNELSTSQTILLHK